MKLKACKTSTTCPYLTPPCVPNVRSRDEFDGSMPSSVSGEDGTHKRARIDVAGPTAAHPHSPIKDDTNASIESGKRVSSISVVVDLEEPEASPTVTKSLQELVPLPQLQSLPAGAGTADLPNFAAMPSFTRGFITKYIGGSNTACGIIHVGQDKRAVQIVKCDEYLVPRPSLNPHLPCMPGQHLALLDLACPAELEVEQNQQTPFPVFLSPNNEGWHYSGHYTESVGAEMVRETVQRQLVSEAMLDNWVRSLFESSHALTDLGFMVLSSSGLYDDPNKWKTITKTKVKLAIKTVSQFSLQIQMELTGAVEERWTSIYPNPVLVSASAMRAL